MSENKKMNSEELKNVAGGQLNPGDPSSSLAVENPRKLVGPYDLSGGRTPMKRTCKNCGKEFYATRGDNEHMSSRHMNYCEACR